MKIGRLRIALAGGIVVATAVVWFAARSDVPGAAPVAITSMLAVTMAALAFVQHREVRRLANKVDSFRRGTFAVLGTGARDIEPDVIGIEDQRTEIPQEHLEQMTRLVTAHYSRVEQALDDLARRLDTDSHHESSDQPAAQALPPPTSNPPSNRNGHDDYYGLPVLRYESVRQIDVRSVDRAIHEIPASGRALLPIYVDATSGADLLVTLHGRLTSRDRYPTFERVRAVADMGFACLSIADPATLPDTRRLGWFQGDREHDLAVSIVDVITHVRAQLDARRLVIYGEGSGGHAALRASTMIPDSVALVSSPHTDITRCEAKYVQPLLDEAFDGIPLPQARKTLGSRLSVVDLYGETSPDNLVYYVQNRDDTHTMQQHFPAFAGLYGVDDAGGASSDGRKFFSVESRPASRMLTTREFRSYVESAHALADDHIRSAAAGEPVM